MLQGLSILGTNTTYTNTRTPISHTHTRTTPANNGHFWMFSPTDIMSRDRLDPVTAKVVSWAILPHPARDPLMQGENSDDYVR
jgi:hypothetical protein